MARGFRGRAPTRRRIRNLQWARILDPPTAVAGAGTAVSLFAFVPENPGIDLTVLRLRGNFSIESDQAAASETQVGVLGAIMVTSDAFAAGVGSMPAPIASAEDDWMLFEPFSESFLFADATGFNSNAARQYKFDSKAKRIVAGNGMVLAVTVQSEASSDGLIIQLNLSVLAQVRGV